MVAMSETIHISRLTWWKCREITPDSVALAMKIGLQQALADPATWAFAIQGAKANAEAGGPAASRLTVVV